MSGWLPPGVTDHDIDVAAGYYDEPEQDEPDEEDEDSDGTR